ncbi:hypothetical protein ACFXBB_34215 [Streptomyces scopuliridis]|uniref:hypothetical protein n=1 Tax=Streptomyces scopuliridis TaxID=452529 RepID=UPI0036C8DF7F
MISPPGKSAPHARGPHRAQRDSRVTRRFEQTEGKADREFGIVKSDFTALRLQVGNLDQKVANVDEKVGRLADELYGLTDDVRGMNEKIDRNQAQIVELLTRLVGKDPDTA